VLRQVFGSKYDEVTREWRRLYTLRRTLSSLLLTKYYSGDKIQKDKLGTESGTYGGRSTYKVSAGRPNADNLEDLGADGRIR
jgi:hypothetical protein